MDDKLVIIPQPIQTKTGVAPGKTGSNNKPAVPFDQILSSQLESTNKIQFSKHATDRLASRGINLNGEEMNRLNQAVNLINAKGGRDSLVLLNDNALVVSVKNNTVVTVVDKNNLKGNVFTNIDSAVIA